jgi:hypothetical protein
MSWALQRQLLFAGGIVLALAIFGIFFYRVYIYEVPTCFDGVQNQDESGTDCGGSCALLCEAPNVSVLWSRSIPISPGVYHAVAMIRNPQTNAAGSVAYEVALFDDANILITRREGMLALEPGEIRPIFESNIATGERIPARTLATLTPGAFKITERESAGVRVLNWQFDEDARRLVAEIQNQSNTRANRTSVTALLYNEAGTLISASQTRADTLDPDERASVTFTWPISFSESIVRVDILPRIIDNE